MWPQVEQGTSMIQAGDFARELRETPELCDSNYMCYYRDGSGKAR